MKALIYLTGRSFVNNLKKAVKKPVTLLLLIFFLAYAVVVCLFLGQIAVELRFDSVKGLVVLLSVWTIYTFLTNLYGYSSRKGVIFRPGHAHFVFPAPISPKWILIHSAWMNYLLSVAVNLLFVLAGVTGFGVGPLRGFFLFFLGSVSEILLEVSIMVCLYTNETLPEGVLKFLGVVIKFFLIGIVVFFFFYFRREGFSLSSLSAFFDWPGLCMVPVVGWNIAAYRLILLGATRLNIIGTVLYLCTVAGMVLLACRMKCEGEYFEDAAKFADDYVEMKQKKRNGELVFGMGEKKQKIRRVSAKLSGEGAKAIFYRQLLEYKKQRYFIFDKMSLLILAIGVLLAFALRKNVEASGIASAFLLGMVAYLTLIMSGYAGKWETELKNPYLFLLPDRPFKKLWYSTLMEHVRSLLDGCLLCIPMGVIWKISPLSVAQGILIYAVLQASKIYTRVLVQCMVGDLLGKTGQEILRMLMQMFLLGIGVIPAVAAGLIMGLPVVYPVTLAYSVLVTAVLGALASLRFDSMEQM